MVTRAASKVREAEGSWEKAVEGGGRGEVEIWAHLDDLLDELLIARAAIALAALGALRVARVVIEEGEQAHALIPRTRGVVIRGGGAAAEQARGGGGHPGQTLYLDVVYGLGGGHRVHAVATRSKRRLRSRRRWASAKVSEGQHGGRGEIWRDLDRDLRRDVWRDVARCAPAACRR